MVFKGRVTSDSFIIAQRTRLTNGLPDGVDLCFLFCVWVGAAINAKLNATDETVFDETNDKTLEKITAEFSKLLSFELPSSDSSPKLISNSADMPPVVELHASAIPEVELVEITAIPEVELFALPFRSEKDLGNEYFLHEMDLVSLQERHRRR